MLYIHVLHYIVVLAYQIVPIVHIIVELFMLYVLADIQKSHRTFICEERSILFYLTKAGSIVDESSIKGFSSYEQVLFD